MKYATWRLLGNRISGLLMVVILNSGMLAYTAQAAENAANYMITPTRLIAQWDTCTVSKRRQRRYNRQ